MKYHQRYQRQLLLNGFGQKAQEVLSSAAVLVVGAGGLGCPALQYLVAAGVGHIGIADGDEVSITNLHRQVLYTEADIGKNKAEVAKGRLLKMNSEVHITSYANAMDNTACATLFPQYDIVLDCTDNFASRFMINDAAVLLHKPLVFGAVSQYEGQVAVFNVMQQNGSRSCNYRDIFPGTLSETEVQNCAEAGVLGMLPGMMGSLMALETIKTLTEIGELAVNKLISYNGLSNRQFILSITPSDTVNDMPKTMADFLANDYVRLCSGTEQVAEIDVAAYMQRNEMVLVDVRQLHEEPRTYRADIIHIPLDQLLDSLDSLPKAPLVFFCQTGKRSAQAVQQFNMHYPLAEAYSLKGGVVSLLNAEKNETV